MKILDTYYLGNILVVLTQGELGQHEGKGDYAAYIGTTNMGEYEVARIGSKLSPKQCNAFFGYVDPKECRL